MRGRNRRTAKKVPQASTDIKTKERSLPYKNHKKKRTALNKISYDALFYLKND